MNGTVAETETLLRSLLGGPDGGNRATVVVCPPFVSLPAAANMLRDSKISLGAQDMSQHPKGAFTGDISAAMLLTLGVEYVILGHSERRQYHGESDSLINAKAKTALASGLTPIICVGETLTERESGQTDAVVSTQVRGVLAGFTADDLSKVVVAYEPVWAIGTGRTATPEMAEAVHRLIRSLLGGIDRTVAESVPILYGGSVKADNAQALLAKPNIDGALVGGASLVAQEFGAIISAC